MSEFFPAASRVMVISTYAKFTRCAREERGVTKPGTELLLNGEFANFAPRMRDEASLPPPNPISKKE